MTSNVSKRIIFALIYSVISLNYVQITIAEEVKIGISFSIPPYVVKEDNSGMEMEIIEEAFKVKGYKVLPMYMPLKRTFHEFAKKKIDAVINVKEGFVDGYYSDVVINFQNCAISLVEKNYSNFQDFNFLKNKKIVAFQKASSILGENFRNMTLENKNYEEVAKQSIQIFLLLKNRTDFIVMDKNIFKYYRKQAQNKGVLTAKEVQQPVKFHDIFPVTQYRIAFQNKQIRDEFNLGLRTIHNNGNYSKIIEKYEAIMDLN